MNRPSSAACIALAILSVCALGPAQISAQNRTSISLEAGPLTTAFPRLGVWRDLTPRLSVGLEGELAFRSWSRFPDGDQSRALSGTDWRFVGGPSARLVLADWTNVRLFSFGHLSYGHHWFQPFDPTLGTPALDDDPEVAMTFGLGIGWRLSDRWELGLRYGGRWISDVDAEYRGPASAWKRPRLGMAVRFRIP